MKKLLIALAVAAVAVIGNAASVNWNAGTVLEPGGATANKSVTGYLFVIDSAAYTALAAYASDGAALSKAVYAEYGSSLSSAYTTGTTTKKGLLTLTDDSKSYAADSTAYAAIIYTYGTGDSLQYMGNVGSVYVEGAVDPDSGEMAQFTLGSSTGGVATSWQAAAVPEPTSGLLMLLGMAGLALRRRRA